MVIRYWNQTCTGISPDILKAFEGEYDGDEMHVNPVYSERATTERSRWKNTPNKTTEKAMSIYKSLVHQDKDIVQGAYMSYTTCSSNQMLQENTILLMAEVTKTKQEHIKAIARRIKFKSESHAAFDVGDIWGIAKIVSSCVYHDSEGWIGIWSKNGFHKTVKSAPDTSSGNAAVRGISNICACAQ
ncbi:hypothetical protein GcM3_123019 [Golovinomyces cichoracearum]|uniref:Uncharacterized protein n=1 Tax=Golovinomyces cichoracearum TaxID=62708 RepID=A0A420I6R7_9PEZI|nr:hypothetical protein GcM3_123019 [Golovinomyces cichoracearum]